MNKYEKDHLRVEADQGGRVLNPYDSPFTRSFRMRSLLCFTHLSMVYTKYEPGIIRGIPVTSKNIRETELHVPPADSINSGGSRSANEQDEKEAS